MTPIERAAYVDATAMFLGLAIDQFQDGVLRFFTVAADMAGTVDAYSLGPHDESIEIFIPA